MFVKINQIINSYVFLPPTPASYNDIIPYNVTYFKSKKYSIKIPAYFFTSFNEKIAILYSHGNACDIGMCFEFLFKLSKNINVNILCYEYIGYGKCQQNNLTPNEETIYESIESALDYLNNIKMIKNRDIILYGTSIGSAPSIFIASKYKEFAGLILESPFTSILSTKFPNFITNILKSFDLFDNISKIKNICCPVLILHGKCDTTVPYSDGRKLFLSIPKNYRTLFVPVEYAEHNNIKTYLGDSYYTIIQDFIKKKFNIKNISIINEDDEKEEENFMYNFSITICGNDIKK